MKVKVEVVDFRCYVRGEEEIEQNIKTTKILKIGERILIGCVEPFSDNNAQVPVLVVRKIINNSVVFEKLGFHELGLKVDDGIIEIKKGCRLAFDMSFDGSFNMVTVKVSEIIK